MKFPWKRLGQKGGVVGEYIEAVVLAVVLAFFIRSFVIEPYKIPSKSMVPTLLVGDHIFVNKFIYGLRIPATKKWIVQFSNPKRGEVVVFIYPEDESLDFIKRVVGLPGDHIQIKNSKIYINEDEINQRDLTVVGVDSHDKRKLVFSEVDQAAIPGELKNLPFSKGYKNFQIKIEKMGEIKHYMQASRLIPSQEEIDLTVPEGNYFVLGDNRDQSADSRVWGFVPRENLKGRAMFIWLSLDNDLGGIRMGRFGKKII